MNDRRVLFIGLDPRKMDLSAAPPGTADMIQEGVDRSMRELAEAGYAASYCALAEGDAQASEVVRSALIRQPWHCVVIGAGLRLMAKHTALFEELVNLAVESAPGARLAFNATPGDAAAAVRRQLGS